MLTSTEDYVRQCHKIHGNKYSYARCVYTNEYKRVIIGCAKHGYYLASPGEHRTNGGCVKCTPNLWQVAVMEILDTNSISYVSQFQLPEATTGHGEYCYDFHINDIGLILDIRQPHLAYNIGLTGKRMAEEHDLAKDELADKYGYRLVSMCVNDKTRYEDLVGAVLIEIHRNGGVYLCAGKLYSDVDALHKDTRLHDTCSEYDRYGLLSQLKKK